jgi:hypothetical protein
MISLLSFLAILAFPWPFQNTTINRVHRGYGDYNLDGGFHPGVDIAPPDSLTPIENLYGTAYLWQAQYDDLNDQWSLLLTETESSSEGILYHHVDQTPLFPPHFKIA